MRNDNPFAGQYCCPSCNQPVHNQRSNDDPLGCDGPCKKWFHRQCTNVSRVQYAAIIEHDDEWKCDACVRSDTDIANRIASVVTPPPHRMDVSCPDPLPAFKEATNQADVIWGNLNGLTEIDTHLSAAYNEVVKWTKNTFKIPYGRVGKLLVEEMVRLMAKYNHDPNWERIALKGALVILPLVLQKPSKTSKAKDHKLHLERRLDLWKRGMINSLVTEGRVIQKRMFSSKKRPKQNLAKSFCNLIQQGKVSAACKLIKQTSGPLPINEEVFQALKSKHPHGSKGNTMARLDIAERKTVEPVIYEEIDAVTVYQSAAHTQGSGGPTKIDSTIWRQLLCSKSFMPASENLCEQIAILARRLCRGFVDPGCLAEFTACRLIPLNKDPESQDLKIRPIGIGEVLRRIIGKSIMTTLKPEIVEAAGPLQMCAGSQGGVEAAIHTMRKIFEDPHTEAVLLVDAENAFNNLNREASLINMNQICPEFEKYLVNTYRKPSHLYINNGDGIYLLSEEGSVQGDNAGMSMYATSIKPLINHLKEDRFYTPTNVPVAKQVWFADDSGSGGLLGSLLAWWMELCNSGAHLGYKPNPSKCHLVVKNNDIQRKAEDIFRGTGIKITKDGHPYLGSALGTDAYVKSYVEGKVQEWLSDIKALTEIAVSEPHAAYYGYINGISRKWQFLMRTTPNISPLLQPIEDFIKSEFIPALIGRNVTADERKILSLPTRLGGLAIHNPTEMAELDYKASKNVTGPLSEAIFNQASTFESVNSEEVKRMKANATLEKKTLHDQKLEAIRNDPATPLLMKRALEFATEKGASLWLTTQPNQEHGFFLNKEEFRDALCLRYNWPLKGLPQYCACGSTNNIDHCLTCKRGGYVNLRHNALRDTEASLLREVCYDVRTEPKLIPVQSEILSSSSSKEEGARLDVSARGVWAPMDRVFLDVRVTHPNTLSNSQSAPAQIYKEQERLKKRKYNQRVIDIEKGTFTPLVFTTTGGMGPECQRFNKRIAELIAAKRNERYADVITYVRKRLRFSLLKATLISLRGYRAQKTPPVKPIDIAEVAFNIY